MLLLRRYRPADRDTIWSLHASAVEGIGVSAPEAYFADLQQVESQFLHGGGEFVVGEYEGQVVAMGGLRRTSGTRAEITRMRVHPTCQSRGFGTMLLQYLENRAVALGCRIVHLDTAVEQQQAQRFYLRNGYRQVGTGVKEGFTVVYFEKALRVRPEASGPQPA